MNFRQVAEQNRNLLLGNKSVINERAMMWDWKRFIKQLIDFLNFPLPGKAQIWEMAPGVGPGWRHGWMALRNRTPDIVNNSIKYFQDVWHFPLKDLTIYGKPPGGTWLLLGQDGRPYVLTPNGIMPINPNHLPSGWNWGDPFPDNWIHTLDNTDPNHVIQDPSQTFPIPPDYIPGGPHLIAPLAPGLAAPSFMGNEDQSDPFSPSNLPGWHPPMSPPIVPPAPPWYSPLSPMDPSQPNFGIPGY